MKKILLSMVYFFACMASLQAQILFGTTSAGGNGRGGTINKFVIETNELTVVKSFESLAKGPSSKLIQASNGLLYGMTESGVIFSFDPLAKTYKKLWDFDQKNGVYPQGMLLQATDGKLYGMTPQGGINDRGVIFSFDLSSSTYKKLIDFDGVNGSRPLGGLVQAKDGKLYGMTFTGGTNNDGVIFSFDPSSSAFVNLKDFTGADGANPYVSLLQATDGKLYGTTHRGGNNEFGVVFSFDPSNSTYTKIHDFDHINGSRPGVDRGSLVQAANGNLYGFTDRGGKNELGVLFSINPSSLKFTKEMDFSQTNPGSTFTSTNDGKLVGAADSILFSFDPLTSQYRILKNFGNKNNDSPGGPMLQAKDGKLYGTKGSGGISERGVIFSLKLSDSQYTTLKDFGVNADGSYVTGSLVRANNGNLYGLTTNGGSMGRGVIFSLDPVSLKYNKVWDFDKNSGAYPKGGLLLAQDGLLYGLTTPVYGMTPSDGVIFSFDPASNQFNKLINFNGPSYGSLIQTNEGKMYGMTAYGGEGDKGTIFSFDPYSAVYRKKLSFGNDEGSDRGFGLEPMGSLVLATDSKLYGMTSKGSPGLGGAIFSFAPASSTIVQEKLFYAEHYPQLLDGHGPIGNLIQTADGKLYGMTNMGGNYNYGVIFSLDPSSSLFTKLFDFDKTNGAYPRGSLTQAKDGKLYGSTHSGGSNDYGIVFSYDPGSSSYTKLKDFDGINGRWPGQGNAFIEINTSAINTAPFLTAIGNKSANELKKLSFTAKATDKDIPANTLEFSIAHAATGKFPEGATINESTGLFAWTPTEAQGPGTYRVKIKVSDGTCTDAEEIEIQVCEINAEPVLSAIGNKTVNEGFELTFTAAATDSDLPANILTYSISKTSQGNFPTLAVIHPSGGQFTWTPSEDQGPGIYHVKIVVSDGSCTVSEEIRITVNEVNSAPAFTKGPDQILYENAGPQVVPLWATHISKGDPGEETQAVHFIVSNTNKNLFSAQPSISSDGTLSFTPAINACGTATLNVILKDNGGTEFGGINQSPPQTFTITIKTSKIMLSAYPNPFGKNAMVTFTLPADENLVILDVYDLKGSRVKRMYEGRANANQTLKFEFDGSQLSAGMYFLRLATSKQIENFKLMMTE